MLMIHLNLKQFNIYFIAVKLNHSRIENLTLQNQKKSKQLKFAKSFTLMRSKFQRALLVGCWFYDRSNPSILNYRDELMFGSENRYCFAK